MNNTYEIAEDTFGEMHKKVVEVESMMTRKIIKNAGYDFSFYTRFEDGLWRCDINITNENKEKVTELPSE